MSDVQDSDCEDIHCPPGRDYDTFMQETAGIRQLYEAGVPFFTKEQLQDLSRQLKQAETSDKPEILIKGLEGTEETFEVKTGITRAGSEPGTEWVLYVPLDSQINIPSQTTLTITVVVKHQLSNTAPLVSSPRTGHTRWTAIVTLA